MPIHIAFTIFTLFVFTESHHQAAAAESPKPITPTGTVRLFDGKSLTGWSHWLGDTKGKDPRGVYSVRDGAIRISGDGFGYLATKKAYKDYHLTVEMRWGRRNWQSRRGKARDSGVFLHAVGPDGNSFDGDGAFMAAIECQVMQGAFGDILLIKGRYANGSSVPVRVTARAAAKRDADGWPTFDSKGKQVTLRGTGRVNWRGKDPKWKDTLNFRGRDDVESPGRRWTRIECECRGDMLKIWVNGRLVNEAKEIFPRAGKILLQCEGSEVFYRRVELRELTK